MVGIFSMVAFERYKDKIEKATMEKEEEQSEVILFFSFDVVNSSEYKQVNYFGWSKVLNELFKELRRKVDSGIDGAELWRVLGDEIVFIVRIRKENDLFSFIKEIYKILLESVHELKNGKFFERLPQAGDVEIETMKAQNIISLQGTAWIALVSNNSNDGDNILVVTHGALIRKLASRTENRYHENPDNGSISLFEMTDELDLTLQKYNQCV